MGIQLSFFSNCQVASENKLNEVLDSCTLDIFHKPLSHLNLVDGFQTNPMWQQTVVIVVFPFQVIVCVLILVNKYRLCLPLYVLVL